jgi:hypothetical protein
MILQQEKQRLWWTQQRGLLQTESQLFLWWKYIYTKPVFQSHPPPLLGLPGTVTFPPEPIFYLAADTSV